MTYRKMLLWAHTLLGSLTHSHPPCYVFKPSMLPETKMKPEENKKAICNMPPPLYGVCRLKSRCPYATCPAQLLTSECDFHPWGKDHCLVYNTLSHEGEQMCLGISKSFHEGKSYDPNKSYFIWNSPSSDLGLVRDMWSH